MPSKRWDFPGARRRLDMSFWKTVWAVVVANFMLGFVWVVFFASMLGSAFASADTSDSTETQDYKEYGNCAVYDSVDMFTDEVDHVFYCVEEMLTDETAIALRKSPGSPVVVVFSKGCLLYTSPSPRD